MPSYPVKACNEFTPNLGQWTGVGNITSFARNGNALTFQMQSGPGPELTVLSPGMFRVRFNPAGNYTTYSYYAVVQRNFGAFTLNARDLGSTIEIETSILRIVVTKSPYSVAVFRGAQLIHADTPSYNLVYIPGQEVVANFKIYPANARYFGLGEKAGAILAKNEFTTTSFNFDNFSYQQGPDIPGDGQNPLNPSEPLYCSVPFLIENNPNPVNGASYSYGLFFDNPSQSFFNIGTNDYSNMLGKYYFGALFGELDYYFMFGEDVPAVLKQYSALTGRCPMPPRYVFGYHQGAYGYTRILFCCRWPRIIGKPKFLSTVCTSTSTFRTITAPLPVVTSSFRMRRSCLHSFTTMDSAAVPTLRLSSTTMGSTRRVTFPAIRRLIPGWRLRLPVRRPRPSSMTRARGAARTLPTLLVRWTMVRIQD